MSFVLGVHGGGYHTTAAVSDGVSILGTHSASGSNGHLMPAEQVRAALTEAISGTLSAAGVPPSAVESVCAGIAGASNTEQSSRVASLLAELLPEARIQVVADTAVALEAVLPGRPGLVCIAGAGSVACGRNDRGETARAGGWGSLVSDEGSGNWIGQHAVAQSLRALDTGRSTQLIEGVMKHWSIVTRDQLVRHCQEQHLSSFSELLPVIIQVAERGDPLAGEILTQAGIELARLAQIILRKLWAGRAGTVEVVLCGNVFSHSRQVRQVFGNFLRMEWPQVNIRLGGNSSVAGALYLAQRPCPGEIPAVG
jgi:N-acetylglucosamine kinase-like BadF-type ATPase